MVHDQADLVLSIVLEVNNFWYNGKYENNCEALTQLGALILY